MGKDLINIENKEGVLVTTSREIAENFEKEHKNVLVKIEKTITNWAKDNELKNKLVKYFIKSSYIDSKGEERKEYLLTRDGFSYIVMGFTGEKSDKWKVEYIETFNEMEHNLKTQIDVTNTNSIAFLAKELQGIANIMGTFMQTTVAQNQIMKEEIKSDVRGIVKNSIIVKDEQIERTAEMIGIRAKHTMDLTIKLKEKLAELTGTYVNANSTLYKKIRRGVFKEFHVYKWEEISVQDYNRAFAYIDSIDSLTA